MDAMLAAYDAVLYTLFFRLPAEPRLTSEHAFHIVGRCWAIWAICWLVMAFFSKSNKRRESSGQRLLHVIPAMLGFLLLFREGFGSPWFTRAIFPDNPALMLV